MNEINQNKKHNYPQASRDPYEEDQEIAQQKRRNERLKRKKDKRRDRPDLEESDFDSLVDIQSKKGKNRKKKNGHSNLWYDEPSDDVSDELWQDDYKFDGYDEYDE